MGWDGGWEDDGWTGGGGGSGDYWGAGGGEGGGVASHRGQGSMASLLSRDHQNKKLLTLGVPFFVCFSFLTSNFLAVVVFGFF